jgi:hypothetical protein
VTRAFPDIVNFGSAFRYAIEAELATADLATAAAALAPDEEWRETLEQAAKTHQTRERKLTEARQEVNEMILEPLSGIDGSRYLSAIAAEPATSWPEIGAQLLQAEEDLAAFHSDFVDRAGDVLAACCRVFTKAAKQEREAADDLRSRL